MLDSRLAGSRGKKVARAPDGIGACCHGKQGLESLEEMLSALPRVQVCSARAPFGLFFCQMAAFIRAVCGSDVRGCASL